MHADGRRRNTQWWRTRHLLLPFLLTAGCMIGPDFKTPQTDVAAQWLEADHQAVDATRTEYRDWWNVFADPTLTNLIGLAY